MTFTSYYPDGRREFNLADYMKGKPKPRNDNADLTYYNDVKYYKYYTGNTNSDGTAEYEIVRKEVGTGTTTKHSKSGITLADLMRHRERQYSF